MTDRAPLPIFENRHDARRYLLAVRTVIAGGALLVAGVVISVPFSGALPIAVAVVGVLLALFGQALYLSLNAQIWARHHPDAAWDWRTARGFYEGSFRSTIARARAMARQ